MSDEKRAEEVLNETITNAFDDLLEQMKDGRVMQVKYFTWWSEEEQRFTMHSFSIHDMTGDDFGMGEQTNE